METFTNQEIDSELFCGSLKSWGHVDIWAEIWRVNFVGRTNGAFNGPSDMKPKAHFDFIAGDFFNKPVVVSVLKDFRAFVDFDKNFDKGVNWEIG